MTLAFRRWARPRAVAGRVHRTAAGRIEIDAVDQVPGPPQVTGEEARAAGYSSAETLLADLHPGPEPVYRIRFHLLHEPDPRAELAATAVLAPADAEALATRLARLDSAGGRKPWTTAVLQLIATHPGQRATELAAMLGRERDPFKQDVRKLKGLGLTISLDVGYQLSPRGGAWLTWLTRAGVTQGD